MSFMKRAYYLCCDKCNTWDENLGGQTKRGVRKLSKRYGWIARYSQGELQDICPGCAKALENSE